MARYIDADKLYAEMEDLYEHHVEMRNFSADGAVADCLDILAKQPSADVVEVVRCKDCDIIHNKWMGCPRLNGLIPPPMFYCALGKRRTDNDL